MAIGTFAAAWAYPIWGGGAYWIAAALSAIGLVSAVALLRMRPNDRGEAQESARDGGA